LQPATYAVLQILTGLHLGAETEHSTVSVSLSLGEIVIFSSDRKLVP
jgi:hypothetical protein